MTETGVSEANMSIHVDGPFGGCDEQAETDRFEHTMGGVEKALRLHRIMSEPGRTQELAEKIAKRDGYTPTQIRAWLHLQGS